MIDYNKELVKALNTILPTHYEMTLKGGTKTPCISYMEKNNATTKYGDTQAYSRITYQIKVWGSSLKVLQDNAIKIDKVMDELGFKRISSGELFDNQSSMIQKILTYECLAHEIKQ